MKKVLLLPIVSLIIGSSVCGLKSSFKDNILQNSSSDEVIVNEFYTYNTTNAINEPIYKSGLTNPIGYLNLDTSILKVLPNNNRSLPYYVCVKALPSILPGSIARYSYSQYNFDTNWVTDVFSVKVFLQSRSSSQIWRKGSSEVSPSNQISLTSSSSASLSYGRKTNISLEFPGIKIESSEEIIASYTWSLSSTYVQNDPALSHNPTNDLGLGYTWTYVFNRTNKNDYVTPSNYLAFSPSIDSFYEIKQVYPTGYDSIHAYINFDITCEMRNMTTNEIVGVNKSYCFTTSI